MDHLKTWQLIILINKLISQLIACKLQTLTEIMLSEDTERGTRAFGQAKDLRMNIFNNSITYGPNDSSFN